MLVDIFNEVLIRAAKRYPVGVRAFVALANHTHLLLIPEDCAALSAFMTYFGGNVAGLSCGSCCRTEVGTSFLPETCPKRMGYLERGLGSNPDQSVALAA